MDIYEYALQTWQRDRQSAGTSIYFYLTCIRTWAPNIKVWDEPTFETIINLLKYQDPDYYDFLTSYTPYLWSEECEQKFLKIYFSYRDEGIEFIEMLLSIQREAFPRTPLNYNTIDQSQFTPKLLRFIEEYILKRENLIGCSRLPKDLFGKEY